jgi:hypothetical protein
LKRINLQRILEQKELVNLSIGGIYILINNWVWKILKTCFLVIIKFIFMLILLDDDNNFDNIEIED